MNVEAVLSDVLLDWLSIMATSVVISTYCSCRMFGDVL